MTDLDDLRNEWTRLHMALEEGALNEADEDRIREIWDELAERSDVDQPPCPECDARDWYWVPGKPYFCRDCGFGLTDTYSYRLDAVRDAVDSIANGKPAGKWEQWDSEEATHEQDMKPDAAIVPYVEALREAGIETIQSCQGHDNPDSPGQDKGYLWFEPECLTEAQAREIAHRSPSHQVSRRYGLLEIWEVEFTGLSHPDAEPEHLRADMQPIFTVLDVDLPEVAPCVK